MWWEKALSEPRNLAAWQSHGKSQEVAGTCARFVLGAKVAIAQSNVQDVVWSTII